MRNVGWLLAFWEVSLQRCRRPSSGLWFLPSDSILCICCQEEGCKDKPLKRNYQTICKQIH